ncbi:hypothetical protein O181_050398 [Austropuccinia psidii MF-1]|uniref:Uncharacterized protein n=1 Tax=Austropuccinia psidii MF-1 TaxID=1389203 RepID=A0A9Q3HMB5_9BASI|nr:hypothetical protein [Austropuccinia psidii MF-1]
MASSGHFDPSQIYDGYRAVEILDPACTECLAKGKDFFQHYNPQSSKSHCCFIGKKPFCCTGVSYSNVRRYFWSRKDGPFGKEFPVSEAPTPDGTSGFSQSAWQVIPSTPRTFQPVLASIPTTIQPSSPSTSHARPALNPEVRPSPSEQPRSSPITTSQQLQPVASSSI